LNVTLSKNAKALTMRPSRSFPQPTPPGWPPAPRWDSRTWPGCPLRFALPYYVIQGRDDLFSPTPLAETYFTKVEAPAKRLVVIEGAGHFASPLTKQSLSWRCGNWEADRGSPGAGGDWRILYYTSRTDQNAEMAKEGCSRPPACAIGRTRTGKRRSIAHESLSL
jgi:fermentation-respiration switch protein FrsA (DUF1100 family)